MKSILALLSLLSLSALAMRAAPPNVVYMLADDLGWSDISTHPGGTIKTPNVDRLFRQGVELTNFMGWCVCSPTRAMLLTGRHPFRVGTGPNTGGELEQAETTFAEAFKAHGYRTGIFGKWHNGENPGTPEFRAAAAKTGKRTKTGLGVNAHGFDEAWVYYGGSVDYFTRRTVQNTGPVSWWHNREYRPDDAGYAEDLIVQHAVEFIRDNKDRPFFCYVPFHIVHAPLQAKPEDVEAVDANVTDETKRVYTAMVANMDRNVAVILKELDQLGLRENTIVVFTSDNGATPDGTNLPFRGFKHSVYEGGTHLPTVIRWPGGKVVEGKWDGLCGALDMFPTLMAMAGLKMPVTRPLDGKNIWPAFRDGGASPVESYYWAWRNEDAIRTAKWRMHRYADRVELYDVQKDVSEATNVAAANPQVVASLRTKMDVWADSLGAGLAHLPAPAKLDAKPAPAGEVLEVTVTVTAQAKAKDTLIVPFGTYDGPLMPTDWVEYDLAIAPDSLRDGFYYSPYKGNEGKGNTLVFKRGEGFDQFGREQVSGPAPRGGPGVWEHRVIGAMREAPSAFGRQCLVFRGGRPGTYKVYIDNLRLRHADGSTTAIWASGEDTRFKPINDTESFAGVSVRTVRSSQLFGK